MENKTEAKKEDYGKSIPLNPADLPGSGFKPEKPFFEKTGLAVITAAEMFQVDKQKADSKGEYFTPAGLDLHFSANIDDKLVEWEESYGGLAIYKYRVFWGANSAFGRLVMTLQDSNHKVNDVDWDGNIKTMIPFLVGRKVQLIGEEGTVNGTDWKKNQVKTFID